MKIIIEIPEKTNAHIRSDYGHGMKGLFDEDKEILCDAIYNGTPYEERPHGEWKNERFSENHTLYFGKCSQCGKTCVTGDFCMCCGADMRKSGESE